MQLGDNPNNHIEIYVNSQLQSSTFPEEACQSSNPMCFELPNIHIIIGKLTFELYPQLLPKLINIAALKPHLAA